MDEQHKGCILAVLPALALCLPDILHFIRKLITILIILARPPPGPFLTHRQRIIGENVNIWNGRDILHYLQTTDIHFLKLPVKLPKL